MNALAKILAGHNSPKKNISDAETKTDRESKPVAVISNSRPTRPCPAGHPKPYGYHHWRDTFGNWHCTECDPPAAVAMVREEFLVPLDGDQNTPADDGDQNTPADDGDSPQPLPGLHLIALQSPDGEVVFWPDTTQAERRQAVDDFAWFDRVDVRRRKIQEALA